VPQRHNTPVDRLFDGVEGDVWLVRPLPYLRIGLTVNRMSHGDKLSELPAGFCTIAATSNSPYAGIAHEKDPVFGIQFHPEVTFVSRFLSLYPTLCPSSQ